MNQATPSIWAIIPVKSLYEGKSRLAGILTVEQRAALIWQFLHHTLATLRRVDEIDQILVISSDAAVLDAAREHHAVALDEGVPCGLNQAVSRAVQEASVNQAGAALILPADLPFMQLEDIEKLIQEYWARQAAAPVRQFAGAICTDAKQEGTNALLVQLPTQFNFQYGMQSFHRHQNEAARLGGSLHLIHALRLEFDLDTEEDWREYQHLGNNLLSSTVSMPSEPSRDSRQPEPLAKITARETGF